MTQKIKAFGIGLALIFSGACANLGIQVKHRSAIDVSKAGYQNYFVVAPKLGKTKLAKGVLEEKIHQAMSTRGFSKSDIEDADLLVTYKVLVDDAELALWRSNSENLSNVGEQGTLGGPGEGNLDVLPPGQAEPKIDKMILVLLQDASSSEVVWMGWSDASIAASKIEEKTIKAFEGIIEELPAKNDS